MAESSQTEERDEREPDSYETGGRAARADHRAPRLGPGRPARDPRPLQGGPRAGHLLRRRARRRRRGPQGAEARRAGREARRLRRGRPSLIRPPGPGRSQPRAGACPPRSRSAPQQRDDRLLGALEEDVGELDLRCAPRLGDRERVDRLLDLVAGRELGAARRRRPCRSCSRRSAAAPRPPRPAGRSSRAGRCRRPRPAAAPRPGCARRRAPARRRSRSRARPGTGASSASSARSESAPTSAEAEMRRDQLRRGLPPPVGLAPLEQRVDRPAPRAPPSSAGRAPRRRPRAAPRSLSTERDPRRPRRGRRSPCRRAAGSAPCRARGRPAAPVPRRRLGAGPGSLRTAVSSLARSAEGEVDADRDLGGPERPASSPGRGSGAGDLDRRVVPRGRSRSPATIRSITAFAGLCCERGEGLTTPLSSSRSRARVAPTWKRRSSSSASRLWASSQSSRCA